MESNGTAKKSGQKWLVFGGGITAAIIIAVLLINIGTVSGPLQTTVSIKTEDGGAGTGESIESSKLKVITSFYPFYEFARNVGGERVEVMSVIPVGVEPHDWEPNPSIIRQFKTAKVFIFIGGGFEPWADSLKGELNDVISVEIIEEFMASEEIELIKRGKNGFQEEHERGVINPHVWLDPILAKHQVFMIEEALIEAEPANAQYYEDNAKAYAAKLDTLDAKIRSELSNCEKDTIVSFHQAFVYFTKRYSLNEVTLSGLAPKAEASPVELARLIDFAKSNDIKVIYAEELVDSRLAEVLAKEVDAQVMILSPVEGLNEEETQKGLTYLEKMEQNLQNLKVGLECS